MRDLNYILQAQQVRREQTNSLTGDVMTVSGTVKLIDWGIAYVDLNFPVTFTEKPFFCFGHEIEQGQGYTLPPIVSCSVMDWDTVDSKSGDFVAKGARVLMYVIGSDDMSSYVHYSFKGTALNNPINAMSMQGTI